MVDIRDCPWCTGEPLSLARDLVCLREGLPFTPELLDRSMEALKLSRRFERIDADVSAEPDGLTVTFSLKPALVIRDIRVRGEYPLFTSDVIKAMSVNVGDSLMEKDLEEQERLVADLYRKEGYAEVLVKAVVEERRGGTVVLGVSIEPGRYYRLESVRIKGNKAILDAEILSRMRSWRHSLFVRESGRFRQTDLEQDIKDLLAVYRQRGHPECTIDLDLSRDEASLAVHAVLRISEGPLYRVSISGNSHFGDRMLKKDIVIFREGNIRDRGLRKSVRNMVERYRADGFLSARVDIEEKKDASGRRDVRTVVFAVTEGQRTLVDAVSFPGARAFDAVRLRKTVRTGSAAFLHPAVFNPDILQQDVQALKALYLNNGYTRVSVDPQVSWKEDRTGVSVSFQISEGTRTVVSSIDIRGLTEMPPRRAAASLALKEGGAFVEGLLKADETTLADLVSARGHPYVKVRSAAVLSNDGTGASITYSVEEGPKVCMGNIYYRGNFITRTSVIRRELGIEPGQPFSLKGMLQGQKRIRDMQAFDSVQFKTMGLKENLDRVTLLIDMQEAEPYYYEGGLGYVTDRGFYTRARAGDRNLFGLNKHLWTGGEVSQIGYTAELGLTQHRIFGANVTNTSIVSYERKEEFNQIFGTEILTASTSFATRPARHLYTSLGTRYEYRDQFLQDNSYTIPEGEEDSYRSRGILAVTPQVTYDTRDSFVRPTRGMYSSYALDISRGFQSSMDNFLRHSANLRLYYTPLERFTLAWAGRYIYIDPYGSVSIIPKDQLAYLGGTMTVRGFRENMLRFDSHKDPVGGRLAVNTSLELRIDVSDGWETALFYDTGAVRKPVEKDAGSEDFRSSVGTAIRYVTPIGPIGVMYGHKLERKKGESAGMFHISMGYTF
jgi:outer membrane protein insertion porin family